MVAHTSSSYSRGKLAETGLWQTQGYSVRSYLAPALFSYPKNDGQVHDRYFIPIILALCDAEAGE